MLHWTTIQTYCLSCFLKPVRRWRAWWGSLRHRTDSSSLSAGRDYRIRKCQPIYSFGSTGMCREWFCACFSSRTFLPTGSIRHVAFQRFQRRECSRLYTAVLQDRNQSTMPRLGWRRGTRVRLSLQAHARRRCSDGFPWRNILLTTRGSP